MTAPSPSRSARATILRNVGRGRPVVSPVLGLSPTQQSPGASVHRRSYHHRYRPSSLYSNESVNSSVMRRGYHRHAYPSPCRPNGEFIDVLIHKRSMDFRDVYVR